MIIVLLMLFIVLIIIGALKFTEWKERTKTLTRPSYPVVKDSKATNLFLWLLVLCFWVLLASLIASF